VRIDCKLSADLDDHRLVSCFVGAGAAGEYAFSCGEFIPKYQCNKFVNLHVFSKGIHPTCYLFSGVFFYIDLFNAAPACFFGLSPSRQDIGLIEGVAAVLSAVGHPVVGESVQGFIFGSTMYKL
jgi:hypothetical protein